MDKEKLENWLLKRIEKTEKELEEVTELNLKIGKGAKLCVYKECLNYIREHEESETIEDWEKMFTGNTY